MAPISRAGLLAAQFELHTRLFRNVLDGVPADRSADRISDAVNHMRWIAGHVLTARWGLLRFAGDETPAPWENLFAHGQAIRDDVDYPTLEAIRERFDEVSPRIQAALTALGDDVLDAPAPFEVPIGEGSTAGFLALRMHHEANPIGQLGLLRKYVLGEPMSYR